MLINFCDSAFALGESQQDTRVRYFKQLKARNTEVKYHSDQVGVCELIKPGNFLHFKWLGYGAEREHLQPMRAAGKGNKVSAARALKETGVSNVVIARELGVSERTVRPWLKNAKANLQACPIILRRHK